MRINFSMLSKLLKRRKIWSSAVYRFDSLGEVFEIEGKIDLLLKPEKIILSKGRKNTIADPFLIKIKNELYLFYEGQSDFHIGEIYCQKKTNGLWVDMGCVLSEKFHISYPNVFLCKNNIFMLPETGASGGIRIYISKSFPCSWELYAVVADGVFYDPTIVILDYSVTILATDVNNNLVRFVADCLDGPFLKVPGVITSNKFNSRSAGSIFKIEDCFYRPAQDCREEYGYGLNFNLIKHVSKDCYVEIDADLSFMVNRPEWAKLGCHTFNVCEFDGFFYVATDGKSYDWLGNNLILAFFKVKEIVFKTFSRMFLRAKPN